MELNDGVVNEASLHEGSIEWQGQRECTGAAGDYDVRKWNVFEHFIQKDKIGKC